MNRHMVDSSGGEMKKEKERSENGNGVTNHPATTIKKRHNEGDPQPYPSIEIGGGDRNGVEWGRNEVGEV